MPACGIHGKRLPPKVEYAVTHQGDIDDDGPVHVEEDLSDEDEDEGEDDVVLGHPDRRQRQRHRQKHAHAADHLVVTQ